MQFETSYTPHAIESDSRAAAIASAEPVTARTSLSARLPLAVQWRKDKMGFVTPEAIWLEQGKSHVAELLDDAHASAGYLDTAAVRAQLDRPPSGTFYTDLFRWYIIELWMRHAFSTQAAA